MKDELFIWNAIKLKENIVEEKENALNCQVGGNHYKDFAIQPVEFITKNRLTFLPSCVIKRLCRYNRPSGKGLEDLQKAIHEIELLIQLEEWEDVSWRLNDGCPIPEVDLT